MKYINFLEDKIFKPKMPHFVPLLTLILKGKFSRVGQSGTKWDVPPLPKWQTLNSTNFQF